MILKWVLFGFCGYKWNPTGSSENDDAIIESSVMPESNREILKTILGTTEEA